MKAVKDEKEDVKVKVEEKPELLPSGPTAMIISYEKFQELEQQTKDDAAALLKLEARMAEVEAERDALKKAAQDDRAGLVKTHAAEVADVREQLAQALAIQDELRASTQDDELGPQRLSDITQLRQQRAELIKSAIESTKTIDELRGKLEGVDRRNSQLRQELRDADVTRETLRKEHAQEIRKTEKNAERERGRIEEVHKGEVLKLRLQYNHAVENAAVEQHELIAQISVLKSKLREEQARGVADAETITKLKSRLREQRERGEASLNTYRASLKAWREDIKVSIRMKLEKVNEERKVLDDLISQTQAFIENRKNIVAALMMGLDNIIMAVGLPKPVSTHMDYKTASATASPNLNNGWIFPDAQNLWWGRDFDAHAECQKVFDTIVTLLTNHEKAVNNLSNAERERGRALDHNSQLEYELRSLRKEKDEVQRVLESLRHGENASECSHPSKRPRY